MLVMPLTDVLAKLEAALVQQPTQRMAARWFSTVYYNAPMPHAIFFYGGFAIHGSYDIARLGGPASHGCIRLHPNDAATLFGLVQREGMHNTTIVVQ